MRCIQFIRRKGCAFLFALPLVLVSLLTPTQALGQEGIAMSGSFYRQAFRIPQGSSVHEPFIDVVVFNTGSDLMEVRMDKQEPFGVNISLSIDGFELAPGGQQQVIVGVDVTQNAKPGEYELGVSAESYAAAGTGIRLVGSAMEIAKLVVVGKSDMVMPGVASISPSAIARTTATLHGNLTKLGTAQSVNLSFLWGTSLATMVNETMPVPAGATGAFSAGLTGLTPGATYYFRAKAVGDGTIYGAVRTFKFLAKAPIMSSRASIIDTKTTTILKGNLIKLGTAQSVNLSFLWGTSLATMVNETMPVPAGATGAFSAGLTGLTPGATYYFRAKAVGDGTIYGAVRTFKTLR